ncbi:MAG: hypothetical protein WAN60_01440 [Candidatus Sulfotelmatobacter sp.]
MLRLQSSVVAVLLLSSFAWAQNSAPSDAETIALLAQQVKALQKETMELRERVKTLEAGESKAQTAPPEAAVAAPTPQPSQSVPEPAAAEASPRLNAELHDLHRIQWRGFGEVDYKVLNQRPPELGTYGFVPGSQGNFYSGDFGLFLTARLTAKASVLGEMVFEEIDAQRYKVDLRRMLLKYDYDDYFKLSFGRYQTSVGYYNWAFRSAAWLQTTADRPLVMEFASNGGLLPTQAIGVSVTGAIPSGRLGLNYVAEYGSSDTMRPDLNGDGFVTDENNGNQTNVGLFARPDWLRGLQFGGSYYHDQISNNMLNRLGGTPLPPLPGSLGPAVRYGQTIVNAYAVYVAHGIEFLNEGFLIRQALVGGSLHFDVPAFYSQFSRQLGPVRPFFRYQYVNASSNNNSVFDDVGLRFGPSFGVRYDLNDYIALKAQLDHTARGGEPDLNGLQLQVAFTF